MSVLHRNRNAPAGPAVTEPPLSADSLPRSSEARVTRTRTGAVWVGICVAVLMFVVLVAHLMLQNTGSVAVSFLWLDGSLPLGLALLIAGVGAGILASVVGTARITQLRRRISHRRR
jgi:uncharacterized integral membrane protein